MKRNLRNMVELRKLLKNPSPNLKVPVYDDNKEEGTKPVKKSNKGKMTLAKLSVTVNDLSTTVNDLSTTVNDLSVTVSNLAKEMRDGFKRLDSKMEAGFKQVNTRLDYIVSANNLKDLPKNRKI